jgi:membrane fusion protein, hemolysin D
MSGRTVVPFPQRGRLRERDTLAFLPAALEIVETPPSPIGRAIAATIILLFCMALLWAALGSVNIIATAPGTIVPDGRIKIVQPFAIGIVREIRVHDGERVKKGQLLIALDPTVSDAERKHAEDDLFAAELEAARLRAELSGGTDPLAAFAPPVGGSPMLVASERELLSEQVADQHAKLTELDREAARKAADRAAAAATIAKIEALLPLLQSQVDIRQTLYQHQTGSKLVYLQTLQALVEQQKQLPIEQNHLREAEAALGAIAATRAHTVDEFRSTVSDELVKAEAKVAGLQQDLVRAVENNRRQRLTTPVDGIVQQLATHTVGGVVTPAQALLAIVPTGQHLEIEARLANRDIGFVHAGETAAVKIAAFPYTRYGLLYGKVESVSADAVSPDLRQDATGLDRPAQGRAASAAATAQEPVYQARIRLDRTQMKIGDNMVDLLPGMAVSVEIKTGRRRIISYLLSPLLKYGHDAIRQR